MLELFLLIGYSLLVGAVGLVVVLRSRLSESEREAQRLSHGWAEAKEKIVRLNNSLDNFSKDCIQKAQRIQKLEGRLAQYRQKDLSPWARDLPTSQHFEVVQVPVEAVTLRSALDVPPPDLVDLTKVNLISRLRAEVLKQAAEYVEVQKDCYDPCRMSERFIATLRVYKRRG